MVEKMTRKSPVEKQPKLMQRRRLGTRHLTAAEFREGFEALLRSALLFAAERDWVEAQRGHFASDELAQRHF
jgi:hypothetical protein